MFNVHVDDRALKDVAEICFWYDEKQTNIGDKFLMDFDSIVDLLGAYPFSGVVVRKKFRQMRLARFPFLVIYKIDLDEIVVLSVIHGKRHPRKRFERK